VVAQTAKFSNHSGGTGPLGLLIEGWAAFLIADTLVEQLPDQPTETVCNDADGLLVAEPRHVPAIEDLENAAFVSDRRIRRLIEKAP
jgi:hypothetical protein